MQSRQASTACDRGGRKASSARRLLAACDGQGTLEYALVMFAFMAIVGGLGALWHLFDAGLPVQHALQSASHHVASVAPGALADVFMY